MAANASSVRVLIDGSATTPRLDHPAGVAVHPADGSVWCGGEAGQVHRVEPDGGRSELLRVTAGGSVEVVSDGADGTRLRSPNSCAVAAAGTIYFSESRAVGDPGPGLGPFRGEQLVLANLGRWHLSVLDAGVRGVPLPPPLDA